MVTYLGSGILVEPDDATVRLAVGGAELHLSVCTPRILRVRLDVGECSGSSYVSPRDWSPALFDLHGGEPLRLSTEHFAVHVETDPVRLVLEDKRGRVLIREPEDGGMAIEAAATETGHRRVRARFQFTGEQHFYGLGHGGRQLDRLGEMRQFWNTQIGHGPGSDIAIPLLLSNLGYGLFFDNASDGALAVGRSDGGLKLVYTAESGPLDWYFLIGPNLRGVLHEVAELLGRAPLPPRWALGYLQSTRHFENTAELHALPRTIREKRIPCDGLIFLSSYGDALGCNKGVGHLEFPPELWPDPPGLIAEFREQHFETITHEYPVVHPSAPQFRDAVESGYLLTEGYERAPATTRPNANYREGQRYIDFTNPEARTWWWEQHRELVRVGVAGWWLDGGEGPPATAKLHAGDGLGSHNIYDRFRHQAFAEGEAADRSDQRVFLLCRSGGPGMQRFGASCWTGDINNDFATFEAQVPLGLNTGMSGVPYWGTDIGGFFHPIPESGELYARWFQFGAFSPIFRSHGWVWREHVPWAHGSQIEAICRRYAELRYQLLPYTYTLAWEAHARGLPIMRPLVLNYPDDPSVWSLGSQFLWGDDLLVAPITRGGARSWPVYLPDGTWYDFWTGERYVGPAGIEVDAPLDRLPLLVRSGAIIPLGPVVQHTGERELDEITLLLYPEGISRFELYEDDGRSNGYRRGQYAQTVFECVDGPDEVIVRIGEAVGDRSVVPAGRSYLLKVRAERPASVLVKGVGELPTLSGASEGVVGWWTEEPGFVFVRLSQRASAVVTLRRG